ncbi:hypothetical protein C3B44_00420 [Corynebacterium yudongzhengii]|uniref:Haloacid dehalogenase n=1 Tax=Corynebacterium yudongzhengii TaxID=2080740 RepID=A0A2U1T4G3_9CORY|nr:hypothetical protein [Corynebacterium yudongzhengii]AWB81000.1 hypothetical protein C3B44_00420 [Corynebacterium yudongzhengii]PWC00778.1 hypothetical protein DF222_10975 [Corynebacterium yudongzhengii]
MTALLIDYVGVLAHPPGDKARALVEHALGATGFWDDFAQLRPLLLTGEIDERGFFQRLAARTGLSLTDIDEAIAATRAGQLDLDEKAVRAVSSLVDDGRLVALFADLPAGVAEHLRLRLDWLGTQVPAILSCDLGLRVDDPRAVAVALEVCGVAAEEARYVTRGEGVPGLETIAYEGPEQLFSAL